MVAALDSQAHLDYCISNQNGFAELKVLLLTLFWNTSLVASR